MYSIIIIFSFIGCNGPSQEEYEKLKNENNRLKAEIDDCKNGPSKLLEKIQFYKQNNDLTPLINVCEELISKHPTSREADAARKILSETKEIIAVNEAKKKKENELTLARATKSMFKKKNEFSGIEWYQDVSSPRFVNRNGFYLEFGRYAEGTLTDLFLNIQYYADDWLFIERISFVVDEKQFSITPKKMERDNAGGNIWEWTRESVTPNIMILLNSIADSKTAKMRYHGDKYYDDQVISAKDKIALKNVLVTYKMLGGKLPGS